MMSVDLTELPRLDHVEGKDSVFVTGISDFVISLLAGSIVPVAAVSALAVASLCQL